MVKLTEEMVVARTRVSDFSAVKKLNCWGNELTDVTILRKMKNVEVLSLSVNNINTLADFQYCLNLQDLFVRKNDIKDLNEVCYLQGLPNLRNLWLGENPCADKDGYRLAVLRALPNLRTLDDSVVSPEEVQTALTRGPILVHPLDMDASPPQSDTVSPEDIVTEYIEETEVIRHRRYSSSSDQRSFEETQHTQEEYHDPDRRNANYNASPPHCYSQNNQYTYEEYDDRPAVSRQNGEYDERRNYSDYSNNETTQRIYVATSPRAQYSLNETIDDRRSDRSNYEYDNRLKTDYEEQHEQRIKSDYEEHQPPPPSRRTTIHQNVEREDSNQVPGWVRHSDKEKCRTQFHYHRRPVTRNSNILSAVLCLVKELDYPSLEVVEMAVRNRMDELEE
ncbi:dynein axonemal assembly factor 11-like isoform X3 [Hylaeus volcanicus]|uniref:dynein axonemal assembly factor 11-like isoform X3 n=1 Tax=Hylaeus volcanicus TaxID=313075 RepID=UPI0023B7941D|nr:dynein axonemal assembly factor 11-like isoform X3 [Hylaeus volcanicus]